MKFATRLALVCSLAAVGRPLIAQGSAPTTYGHGDATIRVPLKIESLSPVLWTKAKVTCNAYSPNAGVRPFNEAEVQLTNGAFDGVVEVKISLNVKQRGEQWTYRCSFALFNKSTNADDTAPASLERSGTTTTAQVQGSFLAQ